MDRRPLLAALLALGLPGMPAPASDDEAEVRITFEVDVESVLVAQAGTTAKRLTPEAAEAVRRRVLDETVHVLSERLYEIGIEDREVEALPDGRVVAVVPRTDKPATIRKLLQKTGSLEIRLVRFPKGEEGATREAVLQNYGGRIPPHLELLEGERRNERGVMTGRWYFAVERKRLLSGRDIAGAYQEEGRKDVVVFHLSSESTTPFADATAANLDVPLAIVLDGKVISAHTISEAIHGSGEIATANPQEAEALAAVLTSGPLPARVTVVEEHVISPPGFRLPRWLPLLTVPGLVLFLVITAIVAGRRRR